MNPKVRIIVEEFFPKIIETHIRTRSSIETARVSLERYRTMGLQVIRNLPAGMKDEDLSILEEAYRAALGRLEEFHGRESASSSSTVGQESSESP